MEKETSRKINEFIRKNARFSDVDLSIKIGQEFGVKISRNAVRKRRSESLELPPHSRFKEELLDKGFDGDNWSHGWLKTENVSIFIRNKDGVMSYEEIRDELIAEMRKYAPKYPVIKRVKLGDHLLVADPADVHFGKLSVLEETGEEYDLEIAEKRFNEGIDSLIEKARVFDIHSSVLVVGNDILHIDTPKRTTTAGTPQDTDGMWWQAYNVAKRCYVQAVEKLLVFGDVKLLFCPSNHDFMSGFMLTDAVVSWFSKNKNVSAHVSMSHRKYIKYGKNLIGFTHGDGSKIVDLPNLMMTEARGTEYSFGYWLIHHGHHKDRRSKSAGQKMEKIEEDKLLITEIQTGMRIDPQQSISIEMIRTPSSADRWHDTNGYKNVQAIEVFLFHAVGGQVARLTHYF